MAAPAIPGTYQNYLNTGVSAPTAIPNATETAGFGAASNVISPLSGFTNNLATSFTPQNTFSANAPVNIGALNGQIAQSQGNFNANNFNQNALAQALQQQAQGGGPNPAQAMLQQATNNSIQQNSGMISSQKGINPALAARLGAQNAASQSQAAAGQGAVMGAEQQLGAQNSLQNLYGTIGSQNLQNVATSGGLANQAGLGTQQINANVASQNATADQSSAGGLLGGLGAVTKLFNQGGMVPGGAMAPKGYDAGGPVQGFAPTVAAQPMATAPVSIAGNILQAGGVNYAPQASTAPGSSGEGAGISSLMKSFSGAGGGGAAAAMSKGGKVMPSHVQHIASIYHPDFGAKNTTQLKSSGGKVPGIAKHPNMDTPSNDTVKTKLTPGELVIPLHIMNGKDPVKEGANFIAEKLKESTKSNVKDSGDFKNALKKAISSRGVKSGS